MKMIKNLFVLTMAATLSLTTVGFAAQNDTKTNTDAETKIATETKTEAKTETDKKLITLEVAIKIALEKNIDLKSYDAQKEKIQANIDSYFRNISNNSLYLPGAESALSQVNYGGAQSFLSRDKLERGQLLKTEAIKNSTESAFATISKLRREVASLDSKYNNELQMYNKDVKKQELGIISKMQLEENRLALMELKSSCTSKKTDLDIAYGELNKLLKLPNFSEYTVDNYSVEYEVLSWDKEKVEKYIRQIPDYNMDVLNKKGEAEFNRNEINGILTINNGKEPYMSIKADAYIADFTASQLAEESMTASRDKYNNLVQLQSGISALEQNLKALNLQKNNLETKYKMGQVAKSEVDKINLSIKDIEDNLQSQKETYMNVRRIFENRYMSGLAMG